MCLLSYPFHFLSSLLFSSYQHGVSLGGLAGRTQQRRRVGQQAFQAAVLQERSKEKRRKNEGWKETTPVQPAAGTLRAAADGALLWVPRATAVEHLHRFSQQPALRAAVDGALL